MKIDADFVDTAKYILIEYCYKRNPDFEKLYPFDSFVLFDENETYHEDALYIRTWSKYSGNTTLLVSNGMEEDV